ncbi:hypothetical protein L2E82_21612 [Cichorium intybus]|uniref:Uncharacterized protein n=1 Tax=Cichorium intybus TaxID=13427 RepID=A0ACB9DVR7_CICIN|nr:hypothetical protein L2E82_21612 [Cichorium intybus]
MPSHHSLPPPLKGNIFMKLRHDPAVAKPMDTAPAASPRTETSKPLLCLLPPPAVRLPFDHRRLHRRLQPEKNATAAIAAVSSPFLLLLWSRLLLALRLMIC